MYKVTQHNADTGETYTATSSTTQDAVRRAIATGQAATQYRAEDDAYVAILAESIMATGAADRGFARYTLEEVRAP